MILCEQRTKQLSIFLIYDTIDIELKTLQYNKSNIVLCKLRKKIELVKL